MPYAVVVGQQLVPAYLFGAESLLLGLFDDVNHAGLQAGYHRYILNQGDAVARLHVGTQAVAALSLLLNADGAMATLGVILEELVGHGIADLVVFAAGLCPEVGTLAAALRAEDVPYLPFGLVAGILLRTEQGQE